MSFEATVPKVDGPVKFYWATSAGRIVSGEWTANIVVDDIWNVQEVQATVNVWGVVDDCLCVAQARAQTKFDPPQYTSVFGSIRGRIVNAKGKPLAGTKVYLLPAKAAPVVTDANGYYKFEDVPAIREPYRVATGAGWSFRFVTVDVQGFVENQAPVIKIR